MLKTPKLRFKDKNGNAYPEWSSKQFDEVFEILQNNTFSRKELNYSNKSVKNIHYGDILINYPVNLNCQTCEIPNINQDINLSKYKSSSYLQNGDVIFADTAEDETVGKVCELYNVQEKMLSGLHTIPCRPKFNFASKYLGYFLNSNLYHNQLLPLITGIKVSSVSKSSIKTTEIYYPCLEEQEKIAGFLSKVDELINECESEVKDLEEQKKGLMQKIFSQQIRFKDSNNNPYPDWEEHCINEFIISLKSGLSRELQNEDIGIPVIRANNTYNGIVGGNDIKYWYKKDPKGANIDNYILDDGDILINFINSLPRMGETAIYTNFLNRPCIYTTNLLRLKLNNKLNYKYFFYYTKTSEYINYIKAITKPAVNQASFTTVDFKNLKLLLPCLEEQEKIAKVLSKMNELIEEKKALLSDWQQFKKGLLQQMFV